MRRFPSCLPRHLIRAVGACHQGCWHTSVVVHARTAASSGSVREANASVRGERTDARSPAIEDATRAPYRAQEVFRSLLVNANECDAPFVRAILENRTVRPPRAGPPRARPRARPASAGRGSARTRPRHRRRPRPRRPRPPVIAAAAAAIAAGRRRVERVRRVAAPPRERAQEPAHPPAPPRRTAGA